MNEQTIAASLQSKPNASLVKIIKRSVSPILSKFMLRETLVEGRLKGTDMSFKCLFIGNSSFCEELKARTYEGQPAILRKSRIWIPTLKNILLDQLDTVDLCIAVLPKSFEATVHGMYDYRCMETVHQVIDVSGSWDEIRSRFTSNKRNVANKFLAGKYGLLCRTSKDPADFEFFYHRMFVPHIKKRYGALAEIDTYEEMKEFFRKGQLLLVIKDEKVVTGALALIEDGRLTFRRTGVLDGDESNVEGGAQQALYYFQLRYAHENNLRAVDTMLSSPFLNDGVYINKREWGAAVLPDAQSRNWVYFFKAAPTEKIARFFEINPTIIQSSERLRGVIGASHLTDFSIDSITGLTRRYYAKGLDGFTVVTATRTLNTT